MYSHHAQGVPCPASLLFLLALFPLAQWCVMCESEPLLSQILYLLLALGRRCVHSDPASHLGHAPPAAPHASLSSLAVHPRAHLQHKHTHDTHTVHTPVLISSHLETSAQHFETFLLEVAADDDVAAEDGLIAHLLVDRVGHNTRRHRELDRRRVDDADDVARAGRLEHAEEGPVAAVLGVELDDLLVVVRALEQLDARVEQGGRPS